MTASAGSRAPDWLVPAMWAGLGVLVLVAFWPLLTFDPREGVLRATEGIEGVFFDPSGEDPRLIGALALWMGFTRRGRLALAWKAGRGEPGWAAALFAAALAVAAWAAHTGAADLLLQALQLFVLGGAVLLGGRDGARAMRLPVLFLFLAMPIPAAILNALILPLQLATAKACAGVLGFVGFDAVALGDQIFTRRGIFHVIETCSGTRLALTLVMASVVYCELFARDGLRTLQLLVLAPVVAVAVNLARILSIVFNPYSAISTVHTTQGVFMVVGGVLLVAGVDRGLEALRPRPPREPSPVEDWPGRGPRAPVIALAGVAISLSAVWAATPRWEPPPTERVVHRLPREIEGRGSMARPTDLVFLGSVYFSDRVERIYTRSDADESEAGGPGEIVLFLGEDDHRNRRGSVISQKTAYPGRAWRRLASESATLDDGTPVEVALFAGRESHRLTVHWRDGDLPAVWEALRAWSGIDRSELRRREPTRVWRVAAEVDDASEIDSTREELLHFAQSARSRWQETEPNVRSADQGLAERKSREEAGG